MKRGKRNLITDVPGLYVGNAQDERLKSGVTVLVGDAPFVAGVQVLGGAPGTRETDLLDPDRTVASIDALVLSGGSAFGLDAASGVADALHKAGRGFRVGPARVPIVPAAILFDLLNGGDKAWDENPYKVLGAAALARARTDFKLGSTGAGTGALTAQLKGGLGSASIVLPSGHTVGALVAVNAHGSPTLPERPHFWAAPFEVDGEFGGLGPGSNPSPLVPPDNHKMQAYVDASAGRAIAPAPGRAPPAPAAGGRGGKPAPAAPSGGGKGGAMRGHPRGNTTIAIVATDAVLDKAQARRLAASAHAGIARALVPSHTPFDGDLVFAAATCAHPLPDPDFDVMLLGHAAALCVSRAIARGVHAATEAPGDILPTWASRWPSMPDKIYP